ncbi:MAG TPA: hypothetical protein PK916_08905 [Bacteroidota bacterium]|nr:hypothetical protein [Bacteroidota bacterium]
MGKGINSYEIGEIVDPQWLSDTILHESTIGAFWTKFLRQNYVTDMAFESVPPVGNVDKEKVTFSGAPIEVFAEFKKGGLDKINVPVKRRYRGLPRHGRSQLQGTGEGVEWLFRSVFLWNSKKAFNIPVEGGVDGQILRDSMQKAIENEVRPAAAEWLRDYTEGNINWTLLTGYSAELTTLRGEVDARNTGLTNYSHPNIFVAGHGRVLHGSDANSRPGGAGYETNLVAAANTCLQGGPTANGLSTSRLIAFRNDLFRLGTRPVRTRMGDVYCLVTKESAYNQLELEMGDRAFRETMLLSLPPELKNNPFFGNAVAVYQQMVIYINPGLFGMQTNNGYVLQNQGSAIGMPAYGPSGEWVGSKITDNALDTNDLVCSVGFGAGFLSQAFGKREMWFTKEAWDHEQNKELGMHWWMSLMRSDVTDPRDELGLGADAFAYNDTSAILITYSPYTGSY